MIRTRAALHHALLRLAERMDFAGITITAIAEEAGIGYATFFRHYADKQSLLAAVATELVDELVQEMAISAAEEPARAGQMLARFVDERRGICHALLVGAGNEIRRVVTERAVLGSEAVTPPLSGAFPTAMVISHSVSASLTLMAWWLENPGTMTREALGQALNTLVLTPVGTLHTVHAAPLRA